MASNNEMNLLEAVGEYTGSLRDKDKSPAAIREINRFVKHFQADRLLASITPSQIGGYAEQVGKNTMSEEAVEGLQAVRKFLAYIHKQEITNMNLATHFRVRKSKANSRAGRGRSVSRKGGQEMTQEGHDQLTSEKELLESNRVSISESIQTAAEDGDVRENAPLEAAREQQGREEARIKEIEGMIRSAIIVDSSGKGAKTVRVGATIIIEDVDKKKKSKYTLVSPSEANPLEGKISDASPLGKALIGKRSGQKAVAVTPKGQTNLKILDINQRSLL